MKTLLEFDYKKATQAINYLARKDGSSIDKLKLIKLIYLADRFHLRKYGRPILNDTYMAMPYGPVCSSSKDIAESSYYLGETEKEYASKFVSVDQKENVVKSVSDVDKKVFSESEIAAFDFVYDKFGSKKASELVNVVHRYPEWAKFREELISGGTTREIMSYLDFFKNPEDKSGDQFELSEKALSASKELFKEDYEVAGYWE